MSLYFKDHPEFKPNITPRDMFALGIMGGSYFRQIKSPKTKKIYKNHHKNFKFLKDIPEDILTKQEYDKSINLLSSRITLGLTPRKTSIAAILSLID